MKNELNVSFGIFYAIAYSLSLLLGVGGYLWYNELILLLGFGFFGCFVAARIAIGAVLASLSLRTAWLIAFCTTTLINGVLMGLMALGIGLTGSRVPMEITQNISWLLVAFQLFAAAFILGGLKCHHYRLVAN